MLSDLSDSNHRQSSDEVVAIIEIQTAILKAIHDFLEEQNFYQIIPHTLQNLTQHVNTLGNLPVGSKQKGTHNQEMILNHQMLLSGLNLDKIYSITSLKDNVTIPSHLELEYTNIEFDESVKFFEKLLRRINIDIQTKAGSSLDLLHSGITNWEGTFPVLSRHDIELEFGDSWQEEATQELKAPFFIHCVEPDFYDRKDPQRPGHHYLNFELYLPNQPKPVARGGQREYKYEDIINHMESLGINRYHFSQYLLYVADNGLQPTSGCSVNMDNLISAFTV